jgi:hypothetical protein
LKHGIPSECYCEVHKFTPPVGDCLTSSTWDFILDAVSFLNSFFLFALSSSEFSTQKNIRKLISFISNEQIAKPLNKKNCVGAT